MKKVLIAVALISGAGMSGCVTTAEMDDHDCQSYGANPGSPAYYQCRMIKDDQHQAAMQHLGDSMIVTGLAMMNQ